MAFDTKTIISDISKLAIGASMLGGMLLHIRYDDAHAPTQGGDPLKIITPAQATELLSNTGKLNYAARQTLKTCTQIEGREAQADYVAACFSDASITAWDKEHKFRDEKIKPAGFMLAGLAGLSALFLKLNGRREEETVAPAAPAIVETASRHSTDTGFGSDTSPTPL